jgi:hypothetical protein
MTDDLSRELRERLGRVSLPAAPSSLRDEIESLRSIPAATLVRRRSARPPMMMLAAALVTVGLVAAGIGGALLREPNEPRQDLSLIASPSPSTASSRSSSPSPGKLASTSPSPTAVPITWTTASLNEDWPGLVRSEPAGRPIVVPILLKVVIKGTNCPGDCSSSSTSSHLDDPTGDTGSDALPWADIKDVSFCGDTGTCLAIGFVSDPPVGVDPSRQWLAYGVVVDTDGDGVADWRYGIDNEPVGTPGARGLSPRRWWRTDLHTGRTESTLNEASWEGGGPFWGNHGSQIGRFGLSFGGDTTGGVKGGVPKRFYAWASVIEDGRVVAIDYAPDAGWLVPSADAKK